MRAAGFIALAVASSVAALPSTDTLTNANMHHKLGELAHAEALYTQALGLPSVTAKLIEAVRSKRKQMAKMGYYEAG